MGSSALTSGTKTVTVTCTDGTDRASGALTLSVTDNQIPTVNLPGKFPYGGIFSLGQTTIFRLLYLLRQKVGPIMLVYYIRWFHTEYHAV